MFNNDDLSFDAINLALSDASADQSVILCTDWLEDYTLSQAMNWALGLVIAVINSLLTGVIELLSDFTKTQSKSQSKITVMLVSAWSTYINTIIIILITNLNFGSILSNKDYWEQMNFLGSGIFNGDITSFGFDFYNEVAVVIAIAMFIDILLSNIDLFWTVGQLKYYQWKDRGYNRYDKTIT